MVIVVPGTSTVREIPIHVNVEPDGPNGLTERTSFQLEQVRAVSTGRLIERLGSLDAESRYAIDEILRNVLALD